jgi:peptidoglycan hydrolase CwlO-like protein
MPNAHDEYRLASEIVILKNGLPKLERLLMDNNEKQAVLMKTAGTDAKVIESLQRQAEYLQGRIRNTHDKIMECQKKLMALSRAGGSTH